MSHGIATNQLLLGWLYNSTTPKVATQNMSHETAKGLWGALQELFSVQFRAEEDYLRQVFQFTHKGSFKMVDYLQTMKTHADNLQQVGSLIPPRALVSHVLLGLDE